MAFTSSVMHMGYVKNMVYEHILILHACVCAHVIIICMINPFLHQFCHMFIPAMKWIFKGP
jgi:hypothetical protein